MSDQSVLINTEIHKGLKDGDNSDEQAMKNAKLLIEGVDMNINLLRTFSESSIKELCYKPSDFDPLGRTPGERLAKSIYLLRATLKFCKMLKKQKELVRIMLKG